MEKTFTRVYAEHFNGIASRIAKIIGSRDDADELTQEVFIKYYQTLWAGTEIRNVESWLYKTAGNYVTNFRRRYWARNVQCEGAMEIAGQDGFLDDIEAEELRTICGEIIREELNNPCDMVFFMKGILNYKSGEVARILSLRSEQVTYYFRVSCKKMRAGLLKRGITLEEVE